MDAKSERRNEQVRLATHGLIGGLIAGAVFAAMESVAAPMMGQPVSMPWRMFESIVLGNEAMTSPFGAGDFILAFIIHFVLSGLYGAIFGLIAGSVPRSIRVNWGANAAFFAMLGLLLYLVNFQIIARAAYPWFLMANQLAQIVMHAVFGLVVGLYVTAASRRSYRAELPIPGQRRPA